MYIYLFFFVIVSQKCFDPANPKDAKELLFTQLAQFTVLSTQLVVEFAKQMPGFLDLCIEDQIIMLKVWHTSEQATPIFMLPEI